MKKISLTEYYGIVTDQDYYEQGLECIRDITEHVRSLTDDPKIHALLKPYLTDEELREPISLVGFVASMKLEDVPSVAGDTIGSLKSHNVNRKLNHLCRVAGALQRTKVWNQVDDIMNRIKKLMRNESVEEK